MQSRLRAALSRWSAPVRRYAPVETLLKFVDSVTRPGPERYARFAVRSLATVRANIGSGSLAFSQLSDPEVSIVIPVFNQVQYTYTCLESISRQRQDGPSFEAIVVDDCSTDATPELLASVAGLRSLRNEQQLGFIGSCNAGARLARGHYLVFLNNDTIVLPQWLKELRATFDHHPDAGIVGARLIYPNGRLQEAGGIVWRDGQAWTVGRFEDPHSPEYEYLRPVDYCSGACLMVSRELFTHLGGFDSHFSPAYYEDTDLAFRVRAAGHTVYYQPLAEVVHFEGQTSGRSVKAGVKRHQLVNQEKFAARWVNRLQHHRPYRDSPWLEKDRGIRGRVLFIDEETPKPDRDSGSLRMFNFVTAARRLGFKVTFMPRNLVYEPGYTESLQRLGVEMLHRPYVRSVRRHLRQDGGQYDIIVFSRAAVAESFMPFAREHLRHARLIFDTVDLHFVREEREAALKGGSSLAQQAAKRRRQELRLAAMADRTVVVSTVERDLLTEACAAARVRVVSNIHDIPGCAAPFEPRRGMMFVGGFHHSANVDAVAYFANEVFPLVRSEIRDAVFHVIGSNMPKSIHTLAGNGINVLGYVPNIDAYLRGCRLSVAPLRYGAGVKGKVNMSMSHGLPVVATQVAAEGMHLRPDEDILIADNPQEFAAAVVRLHTDRELWQRLSRNGVEHTERYFSVNAAQLAVQALFSELSPAPGKSDLGVTLQ